MKRKIKNMLAFTLIELMITVAIVAILAAIAYPAYTQYVIRAKRADGKNALLQAQLAQEKWRANNTSYSDDLSELGFTAAADSKFYSTDLHYEIAISGTPDATTYKVTANPSDFADTSCGEFAVDQNGKTTSTDQDTIEKVKECWGK